MYPRRVLRYQVSLCPGSCDVFSPYSLYLDRVRTFKVERTSKKKKERDREIVREKLLLPSDFIFRRIPVNVSPLNMGTLPLTDLSSFFLKRAVCLYNHKLLLEENTTLFISCFSTPSRCGLTSLRITVPLLTRTLCFK